MSSFEEALARNGYSIGLTSSEYTLEFIEYLAKNTATTRNYKDLAILFKNAVRKLELERPASAQVYNLLRDIGLIISEGAEDQVDFETTKNNIIDALDIWRNRVIKECEETAVIASHRLVNGDVVLTHSRSICVLKTIENAMKQGKRLEFYVPESRPGMEGLATAIKLNEMGFKVRLIVDSAVRFFMKNITKVLVGAEAVAVNGAVVSKVGTSLISLIANEARVRVFVVAPTSKFSIETLFGELVELPEGDWRRLMTPDILAKLPENYRARVPIYDVTPPNYIDGIATEHGLFAPQALPVILKEIYGSWPPKAPSIEEVLEKIDSIIG